MTKATGKAAARHRSADVYCNFALTVRKTRSHSKAKSSAGVKQSRKER